MRNARLAAIYGLVVMVIVVMTGVTYGMKTPQTKTPQKNPLVKGTLNAQKKETRVRAHASRPFDTHTMLNRAQTRLRI